MPTQQSFAFHREGATWLRGVGQGVAPRRIARQHFGRLDSRPSPPNCSTNAGPWPNRKNTTENGFGLQQLSVRVAELLFPAAPSSLLGHAAGVPKSTAGGVIGGRHSVF